MIQAFDFVLICNADIMFLSLAYTLQTSCFLVSHIHVHTIIWFKHMQLCGRAFPTEHSCHHEVAISTSQHLCHWFVIRYSTAKKCATAVLSVRAGKIVDRRSWAIPSTQGFSVHRRKSTVRNLHRVRHYRVTLHRMRQQVAIFNTKQTCATDLPAMKASCYLVSHIHVHKNNVI